jgi:hypothetical protein
MGVPSRTGLHADYSIAAACFRVKNDPVPDAAGTAPDQAARFSRISNAGSVLPSSTSRNAPPPVEM